jgi:hypothetical protein
MTIRPFVVSITNVLLASSFHQSLAIAERLDAASSARPRKHFPTGDTPCSYASGCSHCCYPEHMTFEIAKVFWFFSSEKNCFLTFPDKDI